jgi:hypothetical protein
MKQYKVWIHVEEIDEEKDIYEDVGECYSAGWFESEQAAREYIEQELMIVHICGSAALLWEACKAVTSFACEMLYQMNDQVVLDDYPQIRQAQQAIDRYVPAESLETAQVLQFTLEEQDIYSSTKCVPVKVSIQNGQVWMQIEGYGEKCTEDGQGSPVGMEIWQGRLRLIVFGNINSEEPQIVNLERAIESLRQGT